MEWKGEAHGEKVRWLVLEMEKGMVVPGIAGAPKVGLRRVHELYHRCEEKGVLPAPGGSNLRALPSDSFGSTPRGPTREHETFVV